MDKIEKLFRTIQSSYAPKRPLLKKNLTRAGFFRYFFKERRAILNWNEEFGLIRPGFLGFSLKLHPAFKLKIDDLFVTCVLPVGVHLPQLLENGWQNQVVTIKEYNLAVCFEDFCNKMENIRKDRDLPAKRFRILEDSFFRFVSDQKNIDHLIAGLRKMFSHHKSKIYKSESDTDAALEKLARFFSESGMSPSLNDIIVGYNMVETYRFLHFSDIIVAGFRDVVSSEFYNCSIDVFGRIVKYLEGLVADLARLEAGKKKIEWLRAHIPAFKTASPQLLIGFYESLGHSWRTDSDDALLLILLLVEGIMGNLENALNETWRAMDIDEKIVTIRLVSTEEMAGILAEARREYDLARQKFAVIIPHPIMLDEYLENKIQEKNIGDENQAYVYKKIDAVLTLLRTLAEQLNTLYEKRDTALAKVLNYMIVTPEKWRGKPVAEIYTFYIDLILASCGYFLEKKLIVELKEESEIDKQIAILRDKIKWTKDSNGIIIKAIASKDWSSIVANE